MDSECIAYLRVESGVISRLQQVEGDNVDEAFGVVIGSERRERYDGTFLVINHAPTIRECGERGTVTDIGEKRGFSKAIKRGARVNDDTVLVKNWSRG